MDKCKLAIVLGSLLLIPVLFQNCTGGGFESFLHDNKSSFDDNNLSTMTNSNTRYLIMRSQLRPNGPSSFVNELHSVFDFTTIGSNDLRLGFAWEIRSMEMSESAIRTEIDRVFLAANQRDFQVPFLLHTNFEWIWNKNYPVDAQMLEWENWQEVPVRNWWTSWSMASGAPTEFGPKLSYNEPSVLNLIRGKAKIIKDQIALNLKKYPESLFIGVDTGWETAIIRDCKYYKGTQCTGGRLPAYKALKKLGYKASDFPLGENDVKFQAALRRISGNFIKFVTSQFQELGASRVFTHVLIMSDNSIRAQRQPVRESASISTATHGYSLNAKSSSDLNQVSAVTSGRDWAITEAWYNHHEAALKLKGIGLPAGLKPPKAVVLYTWGSAFYNVATRTVSNPGLVNSVKTILGRHTAEVVTCDYNGQKYNVNSTRSGSCPTGQLGSITYTCQSNKSWTSKSACTIAVPTKCSYSGKLYNVNSTRSGSCPTGQLGSITYTCQSNQSWTNKSTCASIAPSYDLVQLYHYYDPFINNHFYAPANYPNQSNGYAFLKYRNHGGIGKILKTHTAGAKPLYQFLSSQKLNHYYSTTLTKPSNDYVYEKQIGYLFSSPPPGVSSVPLCEYYSASHTQHFYTTDCNFHLGDYYRQRLLGYMIK